MKQKTLERIDNLELDVSQIEETVQSQGTQLGDRTTILTASGTANTITLPVTLVDKIKYSFKAIANSTGTVTINGKAFKKLDGTAISSGGIKANKVYDFYYDSTQDCVFILAKAEGDATVADVLAGKIFSNGDDTGLVGTFDLTKYKNFAMGTHSVSITSNSYFGTVATNLNFVPKIIFAYLNANLLTTDNGTFSDCRLYEPVCFYSTDSNFINKTNHQIKAYPANESSNSIGMNISNVTQNNFNLNVTVGTSLQAVTGTAYWIALG